jgi:hypothetical protein
MNKTDKKTAASKPKQTRAELERDLRFATESRERWLKAAMEEEHRADTALAAIKALRARSLKKTLSAELDAIIKGLEAR